MQSCSASGSVVSELQHIMDAVNEEEMVEYAVPGRAAKFPYCIENANGGILKKSKSGIGRN